MWQTPVDIPKSERQFDQHVKGLALGSCFADEMGQRLSDLYFDVVVNPFGVIYNPHTISKIVQLIAGKGDWDPKEVFFHEGLWRHFDFHSRVSNPDRDTFSELVSGKIQDAHLQLQQADCVMITYGSAFVWVHNEDRIVGNCHKLPGDQFKRRLLTSDEIILSLRNTIKTIQSVNNSCEIIFTVSPVRHLRDGLIQNNWSKARLLDAVHSVTSMDDRVYYFPSYEIAMDELRDYRFYKPDKMHLTEEATDYVFSKFFESWFDEVPGEYVKLVSKLSRLNDHKPFHQSTENSNKKQSEINKLVTKAKDLFNKTIEIPPSSNH